MLEPHSVLLYVIVHFGRERLPLIDVVKPFGKRQIVRFARLATFVEQKLSARAAAQICLDRFVTHRSLRIYKS